MSVLRGSRSATEDIDFFCVDEHIMNSIEEVAEAVATEMTLPLNFMNSNIRIFFGHPSFESAVDKSFSQNDILFQNDVLKVYSADYGYQLLSKVDRMSKSKSKGLQVATKDRLDATFYLRELIKKIQSNPTRAEVVALYPGDGVMPEVLEEIVDLTAETYQQRYGSPPFAL